jgi:hypothetical protein
MLDLLHFLNEIISSDQFLLTTNSISFILKTSFLTILSFQGFKTSYARTPWFFLLLVLLTGMVEDFAWIIKLSRTLFFPGLDYRFIVFTLRIAWACKAIQYLTLSFFIQSLIEKKFRLNLYHWFSCVIVSVFSLYFSYLAFFKFNFVDRHLRLSLEVPIFFSSIFIILCIVLIPGLLISLKKARRLKLPKLLLHQLNTVATYCIYPYVFFELIQISPFPSPILDITENMPITSISTVLLTFAIYYSSRRVIGLRFLNFTSHVQSHTHFNFIDDFKNILEQLGYATSKRELIHVTQAFFKDAFNIRQNKTAIYIREIHPDGSIEKRQIELGHLERCVENFVTIHDKETCKVREYLQQVKIFINDEIEFNNFYETSPEQEQILQFLDEINADVFLPIYAKNSVIAYIIIEKNARIAEFYSNIERDEMVVFGSYLGNIINLIQNRNLSALIEREKELKEELYQKHQEINQYKESIRSFLRTHSDKQKIGLIFYKARRFVFGNQAAKELIDININNQLGHPTAKKLLTIAKKVEEYKSVQETFGQDAHGNKLVFSAIPNLEKNNVIIIISYPDISDIIKKQMDTLQNPSEWDYLLYLETTKSGQLINQLIPGTGNHLLNFKINLLKIALQKEAILFDMPEDDLLPTVEILHHISLRQTLHVLTLKDHEKNFDTSIKLFGINPIFGINKESPLLQKLDNIGTLCIQNIDLLHLETQNYLAEFIQYGYFTIFKSEKKILSNVRIICSTNKNLALLVQDGKFSRTLFNLLKKTTLKMPSLLSLPEEELHTLAEGFTEQALQTQTFKNLLELTDKEKNKIIQARPVSLQEFKTKIQQLLIAKSKTNNIYQEMQFDPAYKITDPELVEAARMGKKALKNPKIMALLWEKFKNQNKIAHFLGVNRSSINRRCKEFNLQ